MSETVARPTIEELILVAELVMGWKATHYSRPEVLNPGWTLIGDGILRSIPDAPIPATMRRYVEAFWNPYDSDADAMALLRALHNHAGVTNVSLHGANGWGVSTGSVLADGMEQWGPVHHAEEIRHAIWQAALAAA